MRASALACGLTYETLTRDEAGRSHLPKAPCLGMAVNLDAARSYRQEVAIVVNGAPLYRTPAI